MKELLNKPFAEIIQTSLSHFTAQCWEWDNIPAFGELIGVQINTSIIFGIVTNIQTGSLDPVRYPFPYKKTEEELRKEQPQIFEFLKTTFEVQIVGYEHNNKIYYLTPSKPCKIHAFVNFLSPLIETTFFKKSTFLHLLSTPINTSYNMDELLLAIIKNLKSKNILQVSFIEECAETFSLLHGNDYRRLKLFLQRAQELL